MALKKRTATKKTVAKSRASASPRKAKSALTLPTTRTEPMIELSDYALLIYGDPGVGKTTLAGAFPACVHLMFEPGGLAYRLFQKPVTCWDDACGYADLILSGDHEFSNVCVDTIESAYEMCFDWCVETKLNGQHPHDKNDHGKSWRLISDEFKKGFFHKLLSADVGTIFTSHVREAEIETRHGVKYTEHRPNLSGSPWGIIEGLMDIIGFYEFTGDGERKLSIESDGTFAAKNRLEELFRTVGGDAVKSIPMGKSAPDAYENLINAFDNNQRNVDAYQPKQPLKKTKGARKKTIAKKKTT